MNQSNADHTLPEGTYYACHRGEGYDIDGAESTVRQVEGRGSRLIAAFKKPTTSRLVAIFQNRSITKGLQCWRGQESILPRLEAEACAEALNKLEFIPDRYGEEVIVRQKVEF